MRSLLDPLPETLERWEAEGCPDPWVEVRRELTCILVGTLETGWEGPARPVARLRVRGVLPAVADQASVDEAIAAATRARRRSIRPCAVCGESTPPEHGRRMDGDGFVCHGCMTSRFGVVF